MTPRTEHGKIADMARPFIPGLRLAGEFYTEVVRPLREEAYPGMAYSAALLGWGSDVLGFDGPRSPCDVTYGQAGLVGVRTSASAAWPLASAPDTGASAIAASAAAGRPAGAARFRPVSARQSAAPAPSSTTGRIIVERMALT